MSNQLKSSDRPKCSLPLCNRKVYCRKLCRKHWEGVNPRPCSVEGCVNRAYAKGICVTHRWQAEKGTELGILRAERANARSSKWVKLPHVQLRIRAYKLKSLYGLSLARYLAILVQQGHRCAVCRTEDWGTRKNGKPGIPNVDHDHVTGEVRGLLCNVCNTTLGKLGDSTAAVRDRLHGMVQYLGGSL